MYEVLVSPQAESDLERIIRYIAVDLENPIAAARLADKIEARLGELEMFPAKFPLCRDTVLKTLGYHRIPVGHYLIIFRIDEASRRVLIVHYYHTLQDYESDLLHFVERGCV